MSAEKTFDYIVVGAGSAGCVLASRLSENPNISVCLVEAGPPDRSPLIHIPIGIIKLVYWDKVNWRFMSKPQAKMNARPIYIPRGKTLGGTSSINAMVYMRGNPLDYDDWAAEGNAGWSWADVKPYFIKAERNEQYGDSEHHGSEGPLNVTFVNCTSPLEKEFVAAGESLQYQHNPDFNGETQDGIGQHQVTQKNGQRWSSAKGYLKPVMGRKNLIVKTNSPVARIVMDGTRATGIELVGGQTLTATKEVIVSSGAIMSPKLLMLSGIGDRDELQAQGIETVHHLPGVGKNLQDHAAIGSMVKTKSKTPWGFSWGKMPSFAWDTIRYLFARTGLFSSQLIESGGFIRTEPGLDRPDIQLVFIPGHRAPPPKMIEVGHGYACLAVLLRPKSRGSVNLASTDPLAPPVIDPRFYSEEEDMDVIVKGLKECRRITHADVFKKYDPTEYAPGTGDKTDEELAEYTRNFGGTIFHPVGTCKMGQDEMAVVDERLRVRGVEGLRVVDASIMPTIVGGNTNAPSIMIGEKASDMIKEDAA